MGCQAQAPCDQQKCPVENRVPPEAPSASAVPWRKVVRRRWRRTEERGSYSVGERDGDAGLGLWLLVVTAASSGTG